MIGFKSNQIKTVPEKAFPPKLHWLILTDNKIEKLPKSIGDCILLQKCAEDFYADSNEKDRLELLDFALKLQKADNKIDQNENWLINKLYQYWDLA